MFVHTYIFTYACGSTILCSVCTYVQLYNCVEGTVRTYVVFYICIHTYSEFLLIYIVLSAEPF